MTEHDYMEDISYLDWYFYEDDGTATKEAVKSYERLRDAFLDAQKEKESVVPHRSTQKELAFAEKIGIYAPDYWCGACGFMLIGRPKFCQNCGKKVKWDA